MLLPLPFSPIFQKPIVSGLIGKIFSLLSPRFDFPASAVFRLPPLSPSGFLQTSALVSQQAPSALLQPGGEGGGEAESN